MTDSETTEADLWERARRDDGDAFAILFDRHCARVYHRALGLLADPHDAEDVAAAAFFELWRKRRTVRVVQGSILPWLLVTTVNLARNAQRSSARYQKVLRTMPRSDNAAPPDPQLIETRTRLASSLRQLTSADAALFVLTAIEDLPIAQAAEAVGVKSSAARMRLHRVRTRLRTDLHDLNPTTRPAVEGNC
ncbi:RNA polymerase sigma-70 factor (ECF subfamily) [Rathayibacter sp. PhB93]|uniref:RNA polymerase sigma factor n=1 Tax=unclassified Rathayibacter TaxID=2609250 RepID=UPI000F4A65CB|nr:MULTISPECIES: RNA polymerase sigma factor [unclassified Rathayibacter]ROQ05619.1 RNA polymerase sigma-70 factor (ECF subfamily) [Rathayibacter sp. PhB93]TDQ12310.1 RNA polymerase sigma-70 factor (ECF subfamily) [Rathayibacter sp. PhB1]